MVKVLLIDAFNLVRRFFEGHPQGEDNIHEVISASVRSAVREVRLHEPTHAVVVFDSHDVSWRHEMYPAYKGNRKPTPGALLKNLDAFEKAFLTAGIASVTARGFEADDVIATMTQTLTHRLSEVIILSTDKSFLALMQDRVKVYHHFDNRYITKAEVRQKFGVDPEQLTDYWAIAGDSTNNIKGVPGAGKKAAETLLTSYGSLDAILKLDIDDPLIRRVQDHKEAALLAKNLSRLRTDLDLGLNLKTFRVEMVQSRPYTNREQDIE